MKFSVGGFERERIEVEITGYEREPVGDYYDDNWVNGNVSIQVGGFKGKFNASFITSEFSTFLSQLIKLYDSLNGKAEFQTLEGQLSLLVKGDGKGHIEVEGKALDAAGIGNQLLFNLEIDQSQLARSISDIKKLVSKYVVRAA